MNVIERLNSLSISISCFCSDRCKNEGIKQMKALASSNGYDYSHYEKTGFWIKSAETVTDQAPETLLCQQCQCEIVSPTKTQRFCSQKCKNKFHNSKKS